MLKLTVVLLLASIPLSGSTYYLDYENGSDTNDGLTKTTAWKRHPFMNGWAGAYSHKAGDIFLFKGGVTWAPDCFSLTIETGGTETAWDRYSADTTWYRGATWIRPVFDLDNNTATNRNRPIAVSNASYVEISQVEIKGQKIQGFSYRRGGINIDDSHHISIIQCFIHDWIIDPATTDDRFGGITMGGTNHTILIDGCHIRGPLLAENRGGGVGISGNGVIRNCEIHNVTNGIMGGGEIYNNHIHDILSSYDPAQHENGVYIFGSCLFYNNIVHGVTEGTTVYPNAGWGGSDGKVLIYNNVIFNNVPMNIYIDPEMKENKTPVDVYRIYNNTLIGSGIGVVGRPDAPINTLEIRNNIICHAHWQKEDYIGWSLDHPVLNFGAGTNAVLPLENLALLNLDAGNYYSPLQASSLTTDEGVALPSYFTTDLTGGTRPRGGAWDIGAYEYTATGINLISLPGADAGARYEMVFDVWGRRMQAGRTATGIYFSVPDNGTGIFKTLHSK